MSKAVTISKLEALLARIRTRAAEPRPSRQALGGPATIGVSPAVVPPPAPAPVPAAQPGAVVRAPESPPVVAPGPTTPRAVRPPSPPQPGDTIEETTLPPPPLLDVSSDADFEVEVEVPISSPEPPPAVERIEGKDSGERLSAAPPLSGEPAAVDVGPAAPRVEVISDEEGVADEDEALDEAPASSRRPVMPPPEERLAELAFGSEEPQSARHTPPPKSGRLPAPPAGDFDPDVTGVRATPGLSVEEEATPISAPPAEPSVLSPQPVRPQLASGTNVRIPDIIGEAQAFAPATFFALLDASLSL